MKKNAGFSLIELIVVVAIMAIAATGTLSVVVSQGSYRAKQAAAHISAALSETRTEALAKSNAYMSLTYDSDKGYVLSTSYSSDIVLGKSVTISYVNDLSAAEHEVNASTPMILSYNRSSGSFQGMIREVNPITRAGDGTRQISYQYELNGSDYVYCREIRFSTRGTRQYTITLTPETGKHELVKGTP